MLRVGQRVDEFEVISKLSRGGQATVFLGRAPDTDQYVAIKVLEPGTKEQWKAIRNFIDEAMLSVRIRHRNVVEVYRLGELEGDYYLVMEYLHGCPLSELLREMANRTRGMREEIAVHIATQVALGLNAAHELVGENGARLDVIHRDISPQNIFLTVSGEVKLIDFGIAKMRGRGVRTEKGMIKGKIRYLAPEQARGLALDQRTDIYALGIVLWEMLTMQSYIQGKDNKEIARKVVDPTPIPPSLFADGISTEIDALVLHALQPSPADRPATAAEWVAGLAPRAGREHVAELLRLFTRDTIVEAARELPTDLAEPIVKRAQTVNLLPGEDAETTRITNESRNDALTSRPKSRPRADTWKEVSLTELDDLGSEIDTARTMIGGPSALDMSPTVRSSRHEIEALKSSLVARAQSRVKPTDPTEVLTRKPPRDGSNTRTLLIILTAFVLGAIFAFVYVKLR